MAELRRVSERLRLRGPDDHCGWVSSDATVGFVHRRLAILDLSPAGHQPMVSHCGRFVIVFNGEVYNFRELRAELESRGDVFTSASDTEVLLALYRREGEGMCRRLRGMFALAIWDESRREIFLARDTFGIKPLYWHDDGKALRFASQVKALLAGGAVVGELEPAAAAGFLVWGHVPEPWTTVRGVRSVPPGHWLRVAADGSHTLREYESVTGLLSANGNDGRPAALRDVLLDSVRHHLVADVPVGIFLSAGIDSGCLAALMGETGVRPRTMTLAFEEFRGQVEDEAPLAEKLAACYGMDHETVWIRRQEFESSLPRLLDDMDQPTIDGINTYFVARAASRAGMKVALSGIGGDEWFQGYPSFWQIPRLVRWVRWGRLVPGLSALVERVVAGVPAKLLSPKWAGSLRHGGSVAGGYLLRRAVRLPSEVARLACLGLEREFIVSGLERLGVEQALEALVTGIDDDAEAISALEASCYMRSQLLRDTDWASMAHSLEVRVPLVDREVVRAVGKLRREGRPPTKRELADLPARPLPVEIRNRPKTGFSVPVRHWLSQARPSAPERGLRHWQQIVGHHFFKSSVAAVPHATR